MQTILITGAGSGIGAATARLLSQDPNCRLLLIGRNISKLECVKKTLSNSNKHIISSVDISKLGELEALLASPEIKLYKHPLVSVFANAGIGGANAFGENDRWNEILDVNLTGTYNTCMVSYPWLKKAQSAGFANSHIIITSSCLSRFGVPNQTAYVTSKTGLLGLVRSLASKWSREGILVNAINPGWVETEMARNSIQAMADSAGVSYDDMYNEQSALLPTGRMSDPEEIAELVRFLFSDAQRSITGQAIDINNGSWMS